MLGRAKRSGTSNWFITTSGITTWPRRRRYLTFTAGGASFRLSRRSPRWVCCLLFGNVMNVAQLGHMEKRGEGYVRTPAYGTYARFWNRETDVPCQNPPFGEMIAVDLATGDIAWRSVLGVRDTGSVNLGGSIAT